MATLADSLVSTSSRKLNLRKRGDLSIRTQRHQGKQYYIVKDPVGLGYFRLREEEYAVLEMLDGNTSLDQIKETFERRFAPQQLTLKQLQFFIGQLHRNGLIVSSVGGQGEQLLKRKHEKQKREILGKFTNILAIRFKGVDPERLLVWMHRYLGWIYSKWCIGFCLLLMLSAIALVTVQFDEFTSKLPAFHEFFQAKNAVWLIIALAVTKIIHEFGHGLTCKHFGGECHEIGVMFLVLTPCLYCNVSDSWMLPNKWHRIYISIGGMFVELVIASICTFIWWFSEPGFINYLCLSTIFVCSVSTILFNGNPLLRYDGYYVLSDLMEIPNLWQKSRSVLHRTLGRWCLGLKFPPDPFLPEKHHFWFGLYAVSSSVYRWVVLLSILWFLNEVFEPYRLQILGQMLAVVSITGLVVMPLYQVFKFFWVPGRLGQVKPLRATVSFALVVVAIVAVLYAPIPRRVFSSLVVEPRDARRVYVVAPGELETVHVQPGDHVQEDDPLAQLKNLDVELEIKRLSNRLEELRGLERSLISIRNRENNTEISMRMAEAAEEKRSIQAQLDELEHRKNQLTLRAPIAGTILPPRPVPEPPKEERQQLRTWVGSPLEPQNLRSYLETGTLLCMIGDPLQVEVVLAIDQGDIEFVQIGQEVEILLDELPDHPFRGTITEISESELEAAPEAISAKVGGDLQTRTEQSGREKPASTTYQARVPLEIDDPRLLMNLTGQGKIQAGWTTVGSMGYRYLRQTFNFK